MDSDIDMFNSNTQIEEPQKSPEARSSSCPAKVCVYAYVILFNWKENIQKPFKMYTRKSLKEILEYTINNHLKDDFRIKCLKPLMSLPGEKLSLFARVEAGMSSKITRRTFSRKTFLIFKNFFLNIFLAVFDNESQNNPTNFLPTNLFFFFSF